MSTDPSKQDQKPAPKKGNWFFRQHPNIERNATLLMGLSFAVVTVGGMVEIAPLFYLENTIEEVEGVRPYSPLELAGRDIYLREGCYVCHSQMIRPIRDEVERYGHYSLAAESMYDHPFQWGSKRTGPDLARVGGRYSDAWHVDHMYDPRALVPESVMPAYPWLAETELDFENVVARIKTERFVGTPYTDEMVKMAARDLRAQASDDADHSGLLERYPGAQARNFDGDKHITELDAMIAYLQVLGTMVDFSTFERDESR
ncbi:MAG: cytochrome-c oxidase, cbb3-type subunit II [Pseudomonadota bacterium]